MTVRIKSVTFDCDDPFRLAAFWSEVTAYQEDPNNGNAPGDPEGLLLAPDGLMALLFIAVPEPKAVKNRVHLDMVPVDRRRDEEIARLVGIGAVMVSDHRKPDGSSAR